MTDNGIKRICVSVTDLNKSTSFFVEEMELEKVCSGTMNKDDVQIMYGLENCEASYVMLKNKEQPTLLQLIEFSAKTGKCSRDGRPSWDYGYYDVAFRTKDNTKEKERFANLGFDYYCPPTRYVADWIGLDVLEAVLKGPDSMPMALIERLREPIPVFDGRFSIFTDCAITVKDGDEATRFYSDTLGMKKIFDQVLPDGLVDEIVSVPKGTHTRMLMFSGGNTPITECLEYSLKGKPMCDTAKPENAGIFAVSYEVEDIYDVLNKAEANGFETLRVASEIVMKPYGKILSAFINGPSDIPIEVYQIL